MKKKVTIYLFILFLILLTGCQSNKSILYKYKIDDVDYNKLTTKIYEMNYGGSTYGVVIHAKITLTLNKDKTCLHTGYVVIGEDSSSVVSNSCTYEIEDKTITIYDEIENKSDNTVDKNVLVGRITENGKNIEMERKSENYYMNYYGFNQNSQLLYYNKHFEQYLKDKVNEVLIDTTNNVDYDLNGKSILNKNDSIDLKDYQIIDKTRNEND